MAANPANQENEALLQAIQGLRDDIKSGFDAIHDRLSDIEGRLDAFGRDLGESERRQTDFNLHQVLFGHTVARTLNRNRYRDYHAELAPLHSYRTNELIPDFPRTVADIDNLSIDELDALFSHLDIVPEGDIIHRRLIFKRAIGMSV